MGARDRNRAWYGLGTALVVAGALTAIIRSAMPRSAVWAEVGLAVAFAFAVAAAARWKPRGRTRVAAAARAVLTACPAAAASALLAVAAPYAPEALPLGAAVLAVSLLPAAPGDRAPRPASRPAGAPSVLPPILALAGLVAVAARLPGGVSGNATALGGSGAVLVGLLVLVDVRARARDAALERRERTLAELGHAWETGDAPLIARLADEAGLAIDARPGPGAGPSATMPADATRDPVTGLIARREFERHLAAAGGQVVAVLCVVADGLTSINDEHGHDVGDEVLRAIAGVLHGAVSKADLVARVGSDEFAVLCPSTTASDAATLAERLRLTMHGVVVTSGRARISVGCATGDAGSDPLEVLAAAAEAAREAQRSGGDRSSLVPADALPGRGATVRWDRVLPRVLVRGGLRAVFQPIVDLRTGRPAGYEALARPVHLPDDAEVDGLFAAARRLGVGRDLDWLCRRTAIEESVRLPAELPLFLNVGDSALRDPVHDVDQMLLLLRWGRRDASTVVLEMTEPESVTDLERLSTVAAAYRSEGFRIALDDVGDGPSTVAVLSAATPEYVKLAATLTHRVGEKAGGSLIHTLVSFAADSGAQVVAEGVDSAELARAVLEAGVQLGQGSHLGGPAGAASNGMAARTAARSPRPGGKPKRRGTQRRGRAR